MSRHEFSLLTERLQEQEQQQIGGGARVARIFLPQIDNGSAIRLAGRGHRRSAAAREPARRELGRALEPRRRAS
jgi:hypothetical protein